MRDGQRALAENRKVAVLTQSRWRVEGNGNAVFGQVSTAGSSSADGVSSKVARPVTSHTLVWVAVDGLTAR